MNTDFLYIEGSFMSDYELIDYANKLNENEFFSLKNSYEEYLDMLYKMKAQDDYEDAKRFRRIFAEIKEKFNQ